MKPHVLILEPNFMVRMELRGALNSAGFTVSTCDTLAQARKALQNGTYSLIVLDSLLPDGTGLDLLKSVRMPDKKDRVPLIMLSSHSESERLVLAVIQGGYEYVGKPYSRSYIVKLACALTARQRLAPGAAAELAVDTKVVLVGDKSPRFQAFYGALLRDGHEVILAGSRAEATRLCNAGQVDAVVVDLSIAESGGMETCRLLRNLQGSRGTAIMGLCLHADEKTRVEGTLFGIDEVHPALSDPEALMVHVRGLIRRKRMNPAAHSFQKRAPAVRAAARGRSTSVSRLKSSPVLGQAWSWPLGRGAA